MEYNYLLETVTSDKWKRIGITKRSGVCIPLFYIHSSSSIGIGEFYDIIKFARWCKSVGFSIIQLLPLNELGFDFAPYNSISTFALEPSYISLNKLKGVKNKNFNEELNQLKEKYSHQRKYINYQIKTDKLKFLKIVYTQNDFSKSIKFKKFKRENDFWLKKYAAFKFLKQKFKNEEWSNWDDKFLDCNDETIDDLENKNQEIFDFHYWVQWQLYEQLKEVKNYCNREKIFLMGDIPLLVSRDSADVWSYQNYFKLYKSAGAPPDMYFSGGQRWGMPPYNWGNIANDNWVYLKNKLKYAENFFDMYRIDHFVGLFRIWSIPINTPEDLAGSKGNFDPEQDYLWETHGRKIISEMVTATDMLPCAEDLGTVPDCSFQILREFGIPGMDVLRWNKIFNEGIYFKSPYHYRRNSISVISTHDSSFSPVWWKYEAGTVDEFVVKKILQKLNLSEPLIIEYLNLLFDIKNSENGRLRWNPEIDRPFKILQILKNTGDAVNELIGLYVSSFDEKKKFINFLGLKSEELNEELIKSTLVKINETSSIFSIQLLPEYLYLEKDFLNKNVHPEYRINTPGIINKFNWSLVCDYSIEQIKKLQINNNIISILKDTGRI
ncbi:MAG TPA: 4-alpha-glucanotransferase [Bacteroidetes bacterium]|nr:4-alpha-glucanotransferase [Ignavibacteria bacterium]HCA43837.1 4-alpha-glucanotransferase [Bacteroidota bacterium]HCN37374.1 4-alpha-glucanotransferase [Bacteroidota bacterium]